MDILDTVTVRGQSPKARNETPSLHVYFRCSGRYVTVYRNRQGTGYTARCPACGRCANFRVGPGGTNRRFFEVSC